MGIFSKGDRVDVVQDNYPEPGSATFVGQSGTVAGTTDTFVAVQIDGEDRRLGFEPSEIRHSNR